MVLTESSVGQRVKVAGCRERGSCRFLVMVSLPDHCPRGWRGKSQSSTGLAGASRQPLLWEHLHSDASQPHLTLRSLSVQGEGTLRV